MLKPAQLICSDKISVQRTSNTTTNQCSVYRASYWELQRSQLQEACGPWWRASLVTQWSVGGMGGGVAAAASVIWIG